MMPNQTPSEQCAVLGCIDPDAYTANTYVTGWKPVKDFERLQFIVMAGDLGASATLNGKLQYATSSGGAGATDIPGAAMTQMTQSPDDSNKQAIIDVNLDLLAGTGATHVQGSITIATATSDAGALLLGFNAKNSPASDNDATTVDEIVKV